MADIEAHFHSGPLAGETRLLDAGQESYRYIDDLPEQGLTGDYKKLPASTCEGGCFEWWGWQPR